MNFRLSFEEWALIESRTRAVVSMRPQLEKALLEATNAHPWIAKFKVGTAQPSLTHSCTHPRIHAHVISTISQMKWFNSLLFFFFFFKSVGR